MTKAISPNSSNPPKIIKHSAKKQNNLFAQKVKNHIEQADRIQKLNQPKIDNGTDIAYKKTAAEFEIAFESFMYNLQFSTVDVDPLMGGGIGEEIFRSQLVDSMISKMRENNPGEIAQTIYNKIRRDDTRSDDNQRRISELNDK